MSFGFQNISVSSIPNTTFSYVYSNTSNTTSRTPDHVFVCKWHLPVIEWLKVAMLTFGFIGNGLTSFIITLKKNLHSKTYAVIGFLALSDCVYCLGGLLWGLLYYAYMDPNNYRNLQNCTGEFLYKYLKKLIMVMISSTYLASGFLIAALSVFRYIIISYPLKANILLTKNIVIMTIIGIFTVSFILGVLKTFEFNEKTEKTLDILVSYLAPLSVMVIFHALKIINLKRNSLQTKNSSVRKMEVVVIMVVLAFFLLLLPWHVFSILFEFGLYTPEYVTQTISSLLLQLNNCINPVFYAFLSPRVREGICPCCVRKKNKTRNMTTTQSSSITNSLSCSSVHSTTFSSFQPNI
ncbi:galanin receptor 2b-like [Saccostrea echinata]|uniref:galanin receptor 2b-like n=1 Tax=Saccostrea echinata TaxID=191078 RepID=UPI002A7F47AD|nr:galanin receptor 2b-like [Saccostrea echinata]